MGSYNIADYGAVGDGNSANADINTAAFQKAIAAGGIFVPPGLFVVNDGQLVVSKPNLTIRGEATMGSNPAYGPTSTIIARGPGDTLSIKAPGCSVRGIAWAPSVPGQQTGDDAFLKISATQVSVEHLYMNSPNIGISLQEPSLVGGEFWIENVEMEGGFTGLAGIVANAGDAAVCLKHIVMDGAGSATQPKYGVLVTSCGELVMYGACDIISMGACLALVPGLNGVKNQHIVAAKINECYFDSPSGLGAVLALPQANGFISSLKFTSVWASTAANGNGAQNTNGFTIDGSLAVGSPLPPIQDVSLVNCEAKGFTGRCGIFARSVQGLKIIGSTFGANYIGIWLSTGCVGAIVKGNFSGNYVPPLVLGQSGGNAAYGINIEAAVSNIVVTENIGYGNGAGHINNQAPPFVGFLALNLP